MITQGAVRLDNAHRTPQFWLIWAVLCLNVSAGIGVLAMASPMFQEIFGGSLIGHPEVGFSALDAGQKTAIATIAAGLVGLLSLFNIVGRFFWASLSDEIGRKTTYFIFFGLGIVLYAAAPSLAHLGLKSLFVAAFCVILSMYGGGFATVPAYLADIFGTPFVGAIHGRLLTAWSTAGVVGPFVVGYIREAQIAAGVDRALVYDRTLYILASFLVVGFILNAFVRPVAPKWLMTSEATAKIRDAAKTDARGFGSHGIGLGGGLDVKTALAWAVVCIPLAWGFWKALEGAIKIFG
jgi:MFS family permease